MRKNSRHRDFEGLKNQMKCIYCLASDEEGIADDEFFDIQDVVSGASSTDECKLYRYSSCDDWNLCNLCKQQLHLSPVGNMNDLFEGIAPSQAEGISEKDWKKLEQIMYLKCFSEEWDNLLMWAHYADGCRGMCVEYDLARLEDNHPVFKYLYPVHYSSKRYKKGGLEDISKEIEQYQQAMKNGTELNDAMWLKDIMAFYLIKSKEWSYEKEWRITVPERCLKDSSSGLLPDGVISLPCISTVYLGYRMPDSTKKMIREIVQRINKTPYGPVEIKEIVMDDNAYQLNVKE